MCGIFGYVGKGEGADLLKRMARSIAHRGPDDEGIFFEGDFHLGMRRLSIIDVNGGHQPIFNEDGSLCIVFNGEIYNFAELVSDLEKKGHVFKTRSDTEAIVHLYEEYGDDCVKKLRGMFCFAIFDRRQQRIFVARDRVGIKPLYYWTKGETLIFASEIKGILEFSEVQRIPNMVAMDSYLSFRYVPGPQTLFQGIYKLPAGHTMSWKDGSLAIKRYWQPNFKSAANISDSEYQERFDQLMEDAITSHLLSDVPLGCFLSGGIDSAAIAATMAKHSKQPVKTFTAGFNWDQDEIVAARHIAKTLGCDHFEVSCGLADMDLLPQIVWHLDEPVGDAIVVPMFLLSRLAKENVKVTLSGEGADEVLGGYFFHKVMLQANKFYRGIPSLAQDGLRAVLGGLSPSLLDLAFDYPGKFGSRGKEKLMDYLSLLKNNDPSKEYEFLISLFDDRDKVGLYTNKQMPRFNAPLTSYTNTDYLSQLLSLQYQHWLPDDILMKTDKLAMANSIEGRVPFLDHHLIEFLLEVPPHLKINGSRNKVLLRNYTEQILNVQVASRKKKAFYIPVEQYFHTGPLAEIIETCLSKHAVSERGYFDFNQITSIKSQVSSGDFVYSKQLFSLAMLELWHRIFIDQEKGWISQASNSLVGSKAH